MSTLQERLTQAINENPLVSERGRLVQIGVHDGEARLVNISNLTPDLQFRVRHKKTLFKDGVLFVRVKSDKARREFINTVNAEEVPFAQFQPTVSLANLRKLNQSVMATRAKFSSEVVKEGKKVVNYYFNNIRRWEDVEEAILRVHSQQKMKYRLQVRFGCCIEYRRKGMDEMGVEYIVTESVVTLPHQGTAYFTEPLPYVLKLETLKRIIKEQFTKFRIKAHLVDVEHADYKFLIGIWGLDVKIHSVNVPLGAPVQLPEYIQNNHLVVGCASEEKLCVFSCLAVALGCRRDRYLPEAKRRYEEFYGVPYHLGYGGTTHSEFEAVEKKFSVGLNIYQINPDSTATLIRESEYEGKHIYLNQYQNHLSLITKIESVVTGFVCEKCDRVYERERDLVRHRKTCTIAHIDVFAKESKQYRPKENLITVLNRKYNTKVPIVYPYFIVFDLEATLMDRHAEHGTGLVYLSKHVPASCSIATNFPDEPVKFLTNADPRLLVKEIMEHLEQLAVKIREAVEVQCKPLLDKIPPLHDTRNSEALQDHCREVPVLGFNSGNYDINLMKKYGFFSKDVTHVIKKDNSYMGVNRGALLFLDISNYVAAGCSLDKYMKAFNGRSDKGYFPYEWFSDYEKLKETQLPPIECWSSSMKKTTMDPADYSECQKIWKERGMKTMMDWLEYYNNLDVEPFVTAIEKEREFFANKGLDMLKDGYSVPGLSEKIMFQSAMANFEEFKKQPIRNPEAWMMPGEGVIQRKIVRYRAQDLKAGRTITESMTTKDVRGLFHRQSGCCRYCHEPMGANWSLDRVDCAKDHRTDNCLLACNHCNVTRKDTSFGAFNHESAMKRFNQQSPQVFTIDDENKEVFYKLKSSQTGGASIIFHRYHEAGVTRIQRIYHENSEWRVGETGKMVKKIVGFDANALYLWCLGQEMPCGKLEYKEFDGDMNGFLRSVRNWHGFVECTIHVPEHLYNYFSEMTPIFKNTEIDPHDRAYVGEYMYPIGQQQKRLKSRKLIGCMKGEKMVLYAPLLRWYLDHGLVVSKVHGIIPAVKGRPFKKFMEEVSEARRAGDVDKSKSIIADTMKLVGNSSFGRTGMNKNKHKNVHYTDSEKSLMEAHNNYYFSDSNELGDCYEIINSKKRVKQNMPLQVACAVYQLSKLRMLQFYYDCLDKYLDRSDFQMIEMDTDSNYLALSGDSFEELVKYEMKEEFKRDHINWFPREGEHAKYDRRTPGLFKVEFEGVGMIGLCSKCYYVKGEGGDRDKFGCKGVQERRNGEVITFDNYRNCLLQNKIFQVENSGIRIHNNSLYTYKVNKVGLNPYYDKRRVHSDGIHTFPHET